MVFVMLVDPPGQVGRIGECPFLWSGSTGIRRHDAANDYLVVKTAVEDAEFSATAEGRAPQISDEPAS